MLAGNHPIVGSGYGPEDIVSVLSWTVDPDATSAAIITTLGGVPDIRVIVTTAVESVPVPTLNIWTLIFAGSLPIGLM